MEHKFKVPRKTNSKETTTKVPQNAKAAIAATLSAFILFSALIVSALVVCFPAVAHPQRTSGLAGTTFPSPVFTTIRSQPAYEINIPFSSEGKPAFEPKEVSIPVGMTVIWFNNDNGQHSVTTLTNSTYSPPETIDSGIIPQNGDHLYTNLIILVDMYI